MVLSRAFISGKRREMQQEFMGRAIELSRTHMRAGGDGPFGAVIVKGGDIIAEGYNAVISSKDPTAHAEIMAIRRAASRLDSLPPRRMRNLYQLRTLPHVPRRHLLGEDRENLFRQYH